MPVKQRSKLVVADRADDSDIVNALSVVPESPSAAFAATETERVLFCAKAGGEEEDGQRRAECAEQAGERGERGARRRRRAHVNLQAGRPRKRSPVPIIHLVSCFVFRVSCSHDAPPSP